MKPNELIEQAEKNNKATLGNQFDWGFLEGARRMQETCLKEIDEYFEDLYGRTDAKMFKDEIPKALKERIKWEKTK